MRPKWPVVDRPCAHNMSVQSWMPSERGSFVGRQHEVASLVTKLEVERLVTLVGTGGVGKSRLAARAAGVLAPDAFESVHWAPVWSLGSRALLTALVADACGLSDHSARDPVDALAAWIGTRRVLLILDSCEHLVAECAELVEALLAGCPALVVLATSREPLGLVGESPVRVDPLAPDPDALALFTERAGAVGVRWEGPEDRVAASEVCHWLEGLPLAVELAAAQLPDRPVRTMARLLRGRLGLAEQAGSTVQPSRHRALRTTIGWSHELCEPHERLLWARLSVFRSDVAVDEVVRVCRGGPLTEALVADALVGLRRKSLVTLHGDRVRMLDTVREYGAMWLAELGETGALADRHADHFDEVAATAEQEWWGPGQAGAYTRLSASHADLCAALEHLLATDPPRAAAMAGKLGFFWACCGYLHEAGHYLEECMRVVAAPADVLAKLCWSLGVVRCLRGEYQAAAGLGERARSEALRAEDESLLADAAYLQGLLMLLRGEPLEAKKTADRALQRPHATPAAAARCRLVRVFALTGLGAVKQARDEAEDLRADSVSAGEHWTRSYTEYQLALIALHEERAGEAAAHARSMLRDKRLIGDAFGLGLGLDLLAAALAAMERGDQSAVASGAGQVFWQMVGHPQRGTPELGPLRDGAECVARAQIGNSAYDRTFMLATLTDPFTTLTDVLDTD
ncbi:NB-ARC domain-containing protein [Streptomyces sp. MBT42]|uniref:ATP-binding protein n=1 Tax=Streptomyces sp. MBT42 TaxID=1488373 RepID=UPI0035A84AF0